MKLEEHLKDEKKSARAFADEIGVKDRTVGHWISGRSAPRDKSTMQKVWHATGRKVDANSFYDIPSYSPPADS